jgi:hypothetical protein
MGRRAGRLPAKPEQRRTAALTELCNEGLRFAAKSFMTLQ